MAEGYILRVQMILEPKRICSDTSVIFYHYVFVIALIVCFCFTTADCFSWRYLVFPGGTVPVYSGQQLWRVFLDPKMGGALVLLGLC